LTFGSHLVCPISMWPVPFLWCGLSHSGALSPGVICIRPSRLSRPRSARRSDALRSPPHLPHPEERATGRTAFQD
jgi:hypothetical protein